MAKHMAPDIGSEYKNLTLCTHTYTHTHTHNNVHSARHNFTTELISR